jgi:LPXTG-site transpeptidase (sortase) family protein
MPTGSSPLLRVLGTLLVVIGIGVLGFAVYSFASQRQLEETLEAQIPGQPAGPSATPIVLIPDLQANSTPLANSQARSEGNSNSAPAAPTATAIRLAPGSLGVKIVPDSAGGLRPPTAPPPTPTKIPVLAGVSGPPTVAAPTLAPAAETAPGIPRGQGSPAVRLQIPKLNMDYAISSADLVTVELNGQLVSDWNIPFDGVGHLAITAHPGENGNAVISGHHNLVAPNKFGLGLFAGLWNLAAGDEVRVQTQDGKLQLWRVTDSFFLKEGGEPISVRVQHAQQIMGDTPDPRLTLITCWNGKQDPLSGNTYRWVITSELISIN